MAKADFCFTFYDGDAAREMAHMNRLERGGYMDLIIQQRQRGHLSLDFIKKILGKDFESVWSAIEITLIKDEEGNYFIEWLENSEIKAKKQSRHQSENGKKGGRGNKKESETKPIQSQIKPNESKIKPLGDEDGDGDEVKDVSFGKSENLLLKIKDFAVEIENSYSKIEAAARRNKTSPDVIKSMIPDFVDVCITKSKDEDTWYNYCNYFSNWLANEFSKQKNSTQTKSPHQLREMNYNEKP